MAYAAPVEKELSKLGIAPGDGIRITTEGRVLEGLLLPRIEMGERNVLVLKLENGYNVGISFARVTSMEKVSDAAPVAANAPTPAKKRAGGEVPDISLISTGGTISARVDYRMGGVTSVLDPHEIFAVVPELDGVVNFKSVRSPFKTFSENMTPAEWQKIASEIAKELNAGASGAIVTHGTDTLAYTAAALSFMLPDLPKPVALVGAQRSPDRGSFDGAMNLLCACRYAGYSNIAEVAIVMHGSASDDYCIAVRGSKARKMHTSRRDAFRPINDIPIARIWPDGKIEKLQAHRMRTEGKVVADTRFEKRTALVKAYPGSRPDLLDYLVEKHVKGIVVEATALGQVPTYTSDKELSWTESVKNAIDAGVTVAFATQCLYGSTNAFVYETARVMHQLGVVHCQDMLPEVAYIKLGCLLGRGHSPEEVRSLMRTNLAGEINPRLTHDTFLV